MIALENWELNFVLYFILLLDKWKLTLNVC